MRRLATNWLLSTGIAAAITLLAPSVVVLLAITVIGLPLAIAMMLAPLVFIVSLGSWYIGGALRFGRMGYFAGAALTLLVLAIPPLAINAGLEERASALVAEDLDSFTGPLRPGIIAIRSDLVSGSRRDEPACNGLCMRMLLNGVANRVLIVRQDLNEPLRPDMPALSFHLERRPTCPSIRLSTDSDEIKENGTYRAHAQKRSHELMQLEIARGNCLVEETVPLGTADAVLSRGQVIRGKSVIAAGLNPFADTVSAGRISLHVRGHGAFREAYRTTSVVTFKLAPVLAPTAEGGAELRAHAVLARYPARRNLASPYATEPDWNAFLTKTLGLDLALRDGSVQDDTRKVLAAVAAGKGEVDSASLDLGRDFFSAVSRSRKLRPEDFELARDLLTDIRFSVPPDAWAAVRYAGEAGDAYHEAIARAMFQRLSAISVADDGTRHPPWASDARNIAAVLREMPRSTILGFRQDLEWLSGQERLRVWTWQSLVRLSEFGADAAPVLLRLIDDSMRLKETYGSDWNNAYLAGLIGLCKMGSAGHEMIRPLFARLDSGRMVKHASYWDLTIETLAGMGADPDEIWSHLQTQDRSHTRKRFDRILRRAGTKRDCTY